MIKENAWCFFLLKLYDPLVYQADAELSYSPSSTKLTLGKLCTIFPLSCWESGAALPGKMLWDWLNCVTGGWVAAGNESIHVFLPLKISR